MATDLLRLMETDLLLRRTMARRKPTIPETLHPVIVRVCLCGVVWFGVLVLRRSRVARLVAVDSLSRNENGALFSSHAMIKPRVSTS